MALLTKAPRGMQDILPKDVSRWQQMEEMLRLTAEVYGFGEIRTPTLEHTELFARGVGEGTDVVQKEMYTFAAKEDSPSLTLRPEGTAGVVRAALENNLLADALPQKLYYFTNCYRYEKPQAGRYREFHQFGIELLGSPLPYADAEVIALGQSVLDTLGIKDVTLEINSIGCPQCRPAYHKALKAYFESRRDALCPTCQERLTKNPMRILDCKNKECIAIAKDAPVGLDYLCGECTDHFATLKELLTSCQIAFTVNPKIVRGLDYYTKTVFEFVTQSIGAQGTVCGGGRYDGLVEELGGPSTPGLGFAMGLERLLLVLAAQKEDRFAPEDGCDLYIVTMGDAATKRAAVLAHLLRQNDYAVETDLMNRSLKAQMRYANKIGARYTMVLGENELATGAAQLKEMATGETTPVDLNLTFLEDISNKLDQPHREEFENMIGDILDDILRENESSQYLQ